MPIQIFSAQNILIIGVSIALVACGGSGEQSAAGNQTGDAAQAIIDEAAGGNDQTDDNAQTNIEDQTSNESQPEDNAEPDNEDPTDNLPDSDASNDCNEGNADRSVAEDNCGTTDDAPVELLLNTETNGTVSQGEFDVYIVPSDSQVHLTSSSGDADLFLFNSLDFDSPLCVASKPFLEDTCTASVSDGELYAVVYGQEPSAYNIATTDDCSVESVNRWVYRNMKDYYLFANQVPDINPESYADTEVLVRDLRFEPRDPYSGISDTATLDEFLNDGKNYGFGFDALIDANDNVRVALVFENSSAGRAGLTRGDIIVAIEGELIPDLSRERFNELVGNRDNPRTTRWTIIDKASQSTREVLMTFDEYTINSVLKLETYTPPNFSSNIGYLLFSNFIATSERALDDAIQSLADANITELVLDLRYNPGGYVYIAQRLASQIAGPSLKQKTLSRDEHNEKYTDENSTIQFIDVSPSLNLNRLVVLTTPDTASASELVINSLRPYIEVVTIGTRTNGKSFVSSARKFCGKSLNAMESQTVNASGISVEGGIEAVCYAADDLTRDFGFNTGNGETEGMLQAALNYFIDSSCDVGPVLAKSAALSASNKQRSSTRAGLAHVPDYGLPLP